MEEDDIRLLKEWVKNASLFLLVIVLSAFFALIAGKLTITMAWGIWGWEGEAPEGFKILSFLVGVVMFLICIVGLFISAENVKSEIRRERAEKEGQ